VNAAFLLVTSAWLAGADAAPAAPAVTATASCSGACDACCDEGFGKRFMGRLKGMWRRDDCCDSCAPVKTTCCAPAPVHKVACDSCDHGCRESWKDRLKGMFRRDCDTCNSCETKSCHGNCAPVATCNDCCKESWKDRLKGMFRRNDCCDTCSTCGTAAPAAAPKAEPIGPPKEKMPEGKKAALEINNNQVLVPQASTPYLASPAETKSPFELNRRFETRVNRAPDYSWMTGQLFYVHADGGLWVLRYAPLWKEDPNGGSVVLARDLRMDSYREGDLVTVHGEVLSQNRGSQFLGGPLYRASSMQLVERIK
jgi:hypothetical protein